MGKIFESYKIEDIKITFGDVRFNLKPFLTIDDQVSIAEQYLDTLYDNLEFSDTSIAKRLFMAEYVLILQVIDRMTDLGLGDDEVSIDAFISSGLWSQITSKIDNYQSFRNYLKEIVEVYEKERALDKSVGNILNYFFNRLLSIADRLPDINFEQLKKVAEDLSVSIKQLEDMSPEKETLVETKKRGRPKKTES